MIKEICDTLIYFAPTWVWPWKAIIRVNI